jgi:hypothetical protein
MMLSGPVQLSSGAKCTNSRSEKERAFGDGEFGN